MISSTDFDFETTLFNEAVLPAKKSLFTTSGDPKKYETSYDTFRCTIMLVNNELNRAVSDMLDKVYKVDFSLYIFENASSDRDVNEPIIFNSFEMYLPSHVYHTVPELGTPQDEYIWIL